MLTGKYRAIAVLLLSLITLSIFSTSCAYPALARDRVFLDLSLDFLGEYRLPNLNLDTPVGGLTAITYDRRRDRFYALSDDSQLAPARFYTLKLTLNASDTEKFNIQKIDVESTTLLTDQDGKTYKGSIVPGGIALTPQQTVFISNSTTPSIQEFDLTTGKLLTSLPIPERYLPDAADEVKRTIGVQETSAFASLTLNPTGTIPASGEPIRLFTATKSALVQDREPPNSELGAKSRFLHYLIGYGPPVLIAEHLYLIEPDKEAANGLVELLALDHSGHFLSLERSQGPSGGNIQLFQMTTGGATDTSRVTSLQGSLGDIRPVKKKLLLDLHRIGIPVDKLQGMALGPRLSDGTQSLLLVSDNDFAPAQTTQFLLFRLNQSQPNIKSG